MRAAIATYWQWARSQTGLGWAQVRGGARRGSTGPRQIVSACVRGSGQKARKQWDPMGRVPAEAGTGRREAGARDGSGDGCRRSIICKGIIGAKKLQGAWIRGEAMRARQVGRC